ncbi:hypothetical protein J3Q07_08280 [Pseudomonas sp. D4-18]|uniref:hypothetical protein n=1 Tax=Pseudomonas sp. D4-18 TaxID=2817395 RepID=UPI003DAA0B49
MSDKMREEFEAWALSHFINSQSMQPLLRDEDEPEEYRFSRVNMAWIAWQASREALVITLPNTECFGEYSQEAARVMRDSCADAIEEQGIKFEVSQ